MRVGIWNLEAVADAKWVDVKSVVANGLVLYADAAAYDGSSTWKDLSGSNNHLIIPSGIPSTGTNGSLAFTTQKSATAATLNLATSNWTVMTASRYTSSGSRSRCVTAVGNNWLLGQYNNNSEALYGDGWAVLSGGNGDGGTWKIYTGAGTPTGTKFWANGTARALTGTSYTGPNRVGVNSQEPSECEVSFLLVYNRVLADSEILLNYNLFKGRLGLT
jgi:hypothetical protein